MLIKVLLLVVFFAVTITVGIVCSRKNVSVGDFVMGGRSVGPWLTAFAYGTSYFSAVVFVGYAGQFGWNFGISAAWIGIGNALLGSLLAWVVLGRRTRIMTKHLGSATMPEFFGRRYDSRVLKIVASVIVFVFLVPYSASVYKGLSGLFALSFDIPFTAVISGMALMTGIYVIVGGYMATAINDLIQGFIMIVGMVLILRGVLMGQGGFTRAIEALSQIPSPATPGLQGAFTSMFGPAPLKLLSVLILTSVGTWGLPQMVAKFYAIKNEASIKTGTVISTVFALIIAGGSYFMGGFGRLYYSAEPVVFDEIVPQMLGSVLPDALMGVVLLLVMSASMSTLSSLVLTSSSTFVIDFIGGMFPGKLSEKRQKLAIRVLCAFFIVLSVLIAIRPNSLITTLMSISWGALAGAFLGPFLFGLFWKKTTRAGVWAAMLFGIGFVSANAVFGWVDPTVCGAIAILSSFVIVPLVSLITPKMNAEYVDAAFTCYDAPSVVSQKHSLSGKD
ncbi:MAG: sodium/solute symporter [Clostridia bacterium]|nr:sodium/solute symporter [Clostridia bacterium]